MAATIPDWLVCEQVARDLARLPAALDALVAEQDPDLAGMLVHLLALGGKRIRPMLLLLAIGNAPVDATALRAAAAVELIHIASLYHDDVMDRGTSRRGAPTASRKWGNTEAILAGTLLYARAHRTLRHVGTEAVTFAASATARLCTGQLRELENAFNLALRVDAHLAIIDEKTAALFELAVQLGARIGHRSAIEARALQRFAAHLGRAFQLRDDLLDWTGDPALVGKATQADLRHGVYTLPLLLALAEDGPAARRLAAILTKRALTDADVADVTAHVTPMLPQAERYLAAELTRALDALAVLPPGACRQSLENLVHHCTVRAS